MATNKLATNQAMPPRQAQFKLLEVPFNISTVKTAQNFRLGPLQRAGVALVFCFALAAGSGCQVTGSAPFSTELAPLVLHLAADPGIKLVRVLAGTFLMGSPIGETSRFDNEGPLTRVTLTRDFFLGATDVTQGQYEAVMGTNPSFFKAAGKDAPVESVTWNDAMSFCQKLTERERAARNLPDGYILTLPTEAQWEYACRAGTTGPYAGDLDAMAWYAQNSERTTHPVGAKQPNVWGLYDMHGNVWEWVLDWYGPFPGGSVTDPTGPATGTDRVHRGGSWSNVAADCRSAVRHGDLASNRSSHSLGFRVALISVR
jgi:formylglycine-generating enzyme required for sulfatase activity